MRNRLGMIAVLIILGVIIFWAIKNPATPNSNNSLGKVLSSFVNPETGQPKDLAGVKDFFGGLDRWFKDVSGISISQVLVAIWRLVIWTVSYALKLAWSLVGWLVGAIKG